MAQLQEAASSADTICNSIEEWKSPSLPSLKVTTILNLGFTTPLLASFFYVICVWS